MRAAPAAPPASAPAIAPVVSASPPSAMTSVTTRRKSCGEHAREPRRVVTGGEQRLRGHARVLGVVAEHPAAEHEALPERSGMEALDDLADLGFVLIAGRHRVLLDRSGCIGRATGSAEALVDVAPRLEVLADRRRHRAPSRGRSRAPRSHPPRRAAAS
jgi:hypothetical protein